MYSQIESGFVALSLIHLFPMSAEKRLLRFHLSTLIGVTLSSALALPVAMWALTWKSNATNERDRIEINDDWDPYRMLIPIALLIGVVVIGILCEWVARNRDA